MLTDSRKKIGLLVLTVFCTLLLSSWMGLLSPARAQAASDTLEITGEGVTNPVTYTLAELQAMEQHQEVYSAINTWPTKKWYVGKGVKLQDLLAKAGITGEATLIRFTSADSYTVTLTLEELFEDNRYRFPNFKAGSDSDGHLPGDSSGRIEVEPIIGLQSVEGSDNPKYMNDLNTLLLMLGQRTVAEQTGNLFVKGLYRIEVLTGEPERWDSPQANPGGGIVPAGTMIALSNRHNDDDKVHYTLDGSTPTMESPMYNWIASRWWPARADMLGRVNHPLGPIKQDTVIKAVTIGPGKLDSEVATFTYRIACEEPQPAAKVIQLTIGRVEATVDGRPYTLEAAPYINPTVSRTLVPVRFISEALGAEVAWDSITRQVTIKDRGKEIALIIGSTAAKVDGWEQGIDCAAVVLSGRTFVPLRFIGETLEAEVKYDQSNGQILITR